MRNLQPPITPKIQGSLDTSNFDDYPMDADGPPPGNKLFIIYLLRAAIYNIIIIKGIYSHSYFSHYSSDDVSGWDEAF